MRAQIVLLLLCFATGTAVGQSERKIYVTLTSRQLIRGTFVRAIPDTLYVRETAKLVVGSKVRVVLTGSSMTGEVVNVTDVNLELKVKKFRDVQVLKHGNISSVKVIAYPASFVPMRDALTAIPTERISSLRAAKRGAGTKGFLIGGAIAAAAAYSVGYASTKGEIMGGEPAGIMFGVLFFPIGGVIGSALAKEGHQYAIDKNPIRLMAAIGELKLRSQP